MIFEEIESLFISAVSAEKGGNSSGYRLCEAENISALIIYKNLK